MKYMFKAYFVEDYDRETKEYRESTPIEIESHGSEDITDVWIKACRIAGESEKNLLELHAVGVHLFSGEFHAKEG